MVYVGIDPGQTGAVAVITPKLEVLMLEDFPGNEVSSANLIREIILYHDVSGVALEKVHSMPKQGVASTFKFGTNFGMWRGILAALELPFLLPTPQAWQKGVIAKAQDKKPAVAAAARLFPAAELHGPRGGKKDGRADSLLIAYWCKRQIQNT